MEQDAVKEYGMVMNEGILTLSIIGEIEGHDCLSQNAKTTKYEHILPILARAEQDENVKGILFLMNTVGGDVSCGLALAEMVHSLSMPTVSLVIGDSHSIAVPLTVAADYSFIVPSATMIIHPVRMNGMVLGTPQTYRQFQQIQDRIICFVAEHSRISKENLEKLIDTSITPYITRVNYNFICITKYNFFFNIFNSSSTPAASDKPYQFLQPH